MNGDLAAIFAQFGAAGLVGLLWIMERRHAAIRDRQLAEAHRRLTGQEQSIHALLDVVRDNTRAIVTLEQTQRHVLRLAERLDGRLSHSPALRQRPAGRSDAA